jgi:hypothetical protein
VEEAKWDARLVTCCFKLQQLMTSHAKPLGPARMVQGPVSLLILFGWQSLQPYSCTII